MAQVLIRDLDSETLKKLKQRAEANHRSLQRELHLILSQAAAGIIESNARRPSKRALRGRATTAPASGVWTWLKQPSTGKLSKQEIDNYIRAERKSWESS